MMKLKEKDFKDLPEGKKILSILRQLSNLKEGEPAFPLFQQLMQVFSQHLASETVPTIFPYMIDFAAQSNDLSFVTFVMNMKLGFYQRADLNQLTDQQLKDYLLGMNRLKKEVPLILPAASESWPPEFKRLYLWSAMMLYSFSSDVLVLSRYGEFQSAFKVKCCHCGNDIHSLHINVNDLSQSSQITPAPPPKSGQEMFFDDVYRSFYPIFQKAEEEHFTKILPYVYGSYYCTVCNQINSVMEAAKASLMQEEPYPTPDDQFIKRLKNLVTELGKGDLVEQWCFAQFTVSQLRLVHGLDSLEAYCYAFPVLLQSNHAFSSIPMEILRENALELLKKEGQSPEDSAQLYHWLAVSYGREMDKTGKLTCVAPAQDCFHEAKTRMSTLFGEEHPAYRQTLRAEALFLSQLSSNDKAKPLLDFYKSMNPEMENEEMATMEGQISSLLANTGDLEQALLFKEKELQRAKDNFGEKSAVVAGFLRQKGGLFLRQEEFDQAKDCFHQAFEINIHALGKEYLLPPLLRTIAHNANKLRKVAHENRELWERASSATESLSDLGDIDMRRQDFDSALKNYQKAAELWDWATAIRFGDGVRFTKSGNLYLNIALSHAMLNDSKSAKQFCKKARIIYEIRQKQTEHPEEAEICRNMIVKTDELLGRLS